jgi:hypothetical protein
MADRPFSYRDIFERFYMRIPIIARLVLCYRGRQIMLEERRRTVIYKLMEDLYSKRKCNGTDTNDVRTR